MNKKYRSERFVLIGCIPFGAKIPCFALPIFAKRSGEPVFFVQNVDEFGEIIQRFDALEGYETSEIVAVIGGHKVCGDSQVYCFIDANHFVHAGSLVEISPFLKSISYQCSSDPSLYLQIAELVGSLEERGQARARMRRAIRQTSGEAVAFSFYNVSTLHSVLWDAIAASARDDEALRRIMSKRAQLRVSLVDGSFSLDLNVLPKDDLAKVDINNVLKILEQNHHALQDNESLSPESTIADVRQADFDYATLLRKIKSLGRQEDRVIVLIQAILTDRNAGRIMFNEYKKDRGKFATWVLERLRALLFLDGNDQIDLDLGAKNSADIENIIASFIPEMYGAIFPMNRGYFVFSLLSHLRKYNLIMLETLKIIAKSNNSDVAWYVNHFEEKHGPLPTN